MSRLTDAAARVELTERQHVIREARRLLDREKRLLAEALEARESRRLTELHKRLVADAEEARQLAREVLQDYIYGGSK